MSDCEQATVQGNGPSDQCGRRIHLSEQSVPWEWNVGDVILATYEVQQVHQGGGMGVVYRVRHLNWDVDLAVKKPRTSYFRTEDHRRRFTGECEAWIGLGLHPNIVTCYYVRLLGGVPCVFAEYLEGGDLQSWIADGRLYEGGHERALKRLLDIAIQSAWGLDYAHQKGLIHEDVKPANVLMTPDGHAKVSDFGIAQARTTVTETSSATHPWMSMVVDGGGAMTPAFASPEQINRQPLSRRSDIWSWAISVFQMFVGELTWATSLAVPGLLGEYPRSTPSRSEAPEIPPALTHLLAQCLKEDPTKRPQDFSEVVDALKGIYRSACAEPYGVSEPKEIDLLSDALNNRGISMLDLGDRNQAQVFLRQALKYDPHHAQATFNLGLVQWRSGKITDVEFLSQMEEVQSTHPTDWLPKYLLGTIHVERGSADAAREMFSAADTIRESPQIKAAVTMVQSSELRSVRCMGTFVGHTSDVYAVALSCDGERLLSGSSDNTVKLWDVASGECAGTLTGHSATVASVAFSPDGRLALSGSHDNTVKLWDLATGSCEKTLQRDHSGAVSSVAFSPDGQLALSGSHDNTFSLWGVASGECIRTFEGFTRIVSSVAFSPDGRLALSGSHDSTVKLWDLATGDCIRSFDGHHTAVFAVVFSSDGRLILSGGSDGRIILWNADSGTRMRTFTGHTDSVRALAFSADGLWVLSGSHDQTLRFWDIETSQCVRTFTGHTVGFFNNDSEHLDEHGAGDCGSDTPNGAGSPACTSRRPFDGHTQPVCASALAFRADVSRAISGSRGNDSTVKLWDLDALIPDKAVKTCRPRLCSVSGMETTLNERKVFHDLLRQSQQLLQTEQFVRAKVILAKARNIPGYERHPMAMQLWHSLGHGCSRSGLRSAWVVGRKQEHTSTVSSVAFSPDGRWVLSGSHDKTLKLWDVESMKCVRTFVFEDQVCGVAFDPKGEKVVAVGWHKPCTLWDARTGKCEKTFELSTGVSVAISPDSCFAVRGSRYGSVKVWAVDTGAEIAYLDGHAGSVNAVAFSPDGRSLLSGAADKTLKLWDLATGQCARTLVAHTGSVECLAYSPDGSFAISGSEDWSLKLWDMATGLCVQTLKGHRWTVLSVAFSPDGRWALSGSCDKTLRLWNLVSGLCERVLPATYPGFSVVAFSPDGEMAVAGEKDLRFWELDWDYEKINASEARCQ